MAKFDQKTLEYLKGLCRIECTDEENRDILESLPKILDYVAQLEEVNTDGVKTCRYVLRGMSKTQLRDDQIKDVLSREDFLSNVPDQIGGMVRVPPILKQEN
jgi:aspartyl-tRNA(Asn)/glutamyl-tRNA(Gln) amidotransferase subunit C